MAKFCLILFTFCFVFNSFDSAPLRFCSHSTTSSVRVFNLKHQHEAIVDFEQSTIRLMLNVSWDVFVPHNAQLDGFIYHFRDPLRNPEDRTNPAENVCNIGHKRYWVNTTDSSCSNDTSVCSEFAKSIPSELRLCPISYKSTAKLCKGVGSSFINETSKLTAGYLSVPPNIRNLIFNVSFHEPYFLTVLAYFREFPHDLPNPNNPNKTFTKQFSACVDCPAIVQETTGLDAFNATEFCCAAGIPQVLARDVMFEYPDINFEDDEVKIRVTWLPPIDSLDLDYFEFQVFEPEKQKSGHLNRTFETIPLSDDDREQLPSCDNTTVRYLAVLEGLRPSLKYEIEIVSRYSTKDDHKKNCDERGCLVRFSFTVPAINPCNETFQFCDKLANCSAVDITGATSLNASCTCPIGYDGNGRSKEIDSLNGKGCVDQNDCLQSRSPCVNTAYCFDFEAPALGANCSCHPGYFGDGYSNGKGCTHTSVVALGVTIPVVVIVALICSLMIRRIYKLRRRNEDFAWEQFIANDALRGYTLMNQFASQNDEDVWIPTFGEKWEVDRNKLRIGDIIGRGNYGIVHRGCYDWVNEEGEVAETAVAIKTVKDGANEEFRIKEFLTEIAFMINIGDHPNILKVFGCCTTEKPIYLITDYCKYGDLLHFLYDAREPTASFIDPVYHVTEKSLYQIARQVALGMDFLTKARIIHGDIAARNILVGENLVCKISDFGLANDVYRYGVIQGQSERCVPFKWISPERMMAGKVPITSKSDVWSFGNLLFEMITLGCAPHPAVETDVLLAKLKEGYRMKQPSTCSDTMYSIMTKCWKWRPSSRPSFSSIIKMIDAAVDALREADYVNLADIVMNDVKEETFTSEASCPTSNDDLIHKSEIEINGKTDQQNIVTITGLIEANLQIQV